MVRLESISEVSRTMSSKALRKALEIGAGAAICSAAGLPGGNKYV